MLIQVTPVQVNRMKKSIIALSLILVGGAFLSTPAISADQQLDPRLVFEIGGKAKVKQRRNRSIAVGAGVRWKTPQCGNFDMFLSVSNILNGVTGQLERLGNDLVASVTGVISNWAMIEIARADPQLYEFLQQGKLEASEMFNASVASCEEMSDKIIQEGYGVGGTPGSWVDASGFEDWAVSSDEDNDNDVVQLDEGIQKNRGNNGVKWVGGERAGGVDQPDINTVKDTVEAGVNLLAGRDARSAAPIQQNERSPWFAKFWSTPEEAGKWVTDVVGETSIQTCVDCERLKTKPGKGVYTKLEEEQARIESGLITLLEMPVVTYDASLLESFSAPGYAVSQQIMESLKGETIYQSSLIERLAEEVAIINIVERLIAARRILLAGLKEANIAQNPDATLIINARIKELGEEMELLRQDADLRATTKQSVAVTLLERKQSHERFSTQPQPADVTDAIRSVTGRGRE